MDEAKRPVFFSFSSKDRKIAETISAALEARGFSCWLSTRDVKPGENYQIAIVHAINQAKVLLLIFSSNTNASDEIKKELSLASKRRLIVIPVRVEDVLPDEGMSYELATRQWIDLFAGWEAAMAQLAEQLGRIVGVEAPSPPAAAGAAEIDFPQLLKRYRAVGAAVAFATLLAAGAAYYAFGRQQEPPQTPVPPATVQPSAATDALMGCLKADPDLAIAGCTRALARPDVTGLTRANYFKFRGSSYARKFEYDLAIADFARAIALAPNDGSLFFLRASILRAKGDQNGADADAARAKALGYAPPR